jgi:hypothetical protein
MEAAISAIEDELALVPKDLRHRSITSRSPCVGEIARAAGLDGQGNLSREAVEQVFSRQSAVAMGLPAASEKLPDGLGFIAGLLLTRELMHHLDIDSIALVTLMYVAPSPRYSSATIAAMATAGCRHR